MATVPEECTTEEQRSVMHFCAPVLGEGSLLGKMLFGGSIILALSCKEVYWIEFTPDWVNL
jgi:hypothetical protein